MVVAIDGPAGSGKSSIAKKLSQSLGIAYINSGNIYRAFAYGFAGSGVDPATAEDEGIAAYAARVKLRLEGDSVYLDDKDVTRQLHSSAVDAIVGRVSSVVALRHVVNGIIKEEAGHRDIIVEGRDMTSVVFPDADYRFYVDASVDTRAKRRFKQNPGGVKEDGGAGLTLDDIKRGIEERDKIDREKSEGALQVAPGVEYIDTAPLTLQQVCDFIKNRINSAADSGGAGKGSSMSDPIIEEVQTQMQEEYLKNLDQLEEGQLVVGTIIQVTADQVFVDVGYKSEGQIAISEFEEPPEVGDEVTVVIVTKETNSGGIVVSKQKADSKIGWKTLKEAHQNHEPIEGRIVRQVKGGYEVQIAGDVIAFMPISQTDINRIDKPESMVGEKIRAYIERIYSDGKVNVVVNRRKLLEDETDAVRDEFFENVPVGSEVTGIVKSFTAFGAFVDLGGFDGLLHVNDMSWGHVLRARDFVKKGQELKLKVIRIDPNQKRINLSLKHFTDDPWIHFEDQFHINDIVKGKVTKLAEFGAFIEIGEGIEGLAHISEFSWLRKVQKPGDVLKVGDVVDCMILGYDLQAGRVSLSYKQAGENPWDSIAEKYPVGTRLARKVVKITNAGAFVELEEGVDGFLHVDDISWTKHVKHPSTELKEGDEVEVIVTVSDPEKHSIRLSVKQLSDDPWKSFNQSYRIGSLVEGEVSSVTNFGLFIRVPGGIEGLIHKSNLVENQDEDPDEALKKYKPGDKIKAAVIEVQSDKGKAAFSVRDYKKREAREEVSQYMASNESDGSTFTLGDLIKKDDADANV